MSSIEQYKHKHLGFMQCPSDYDFVGGNSTRQIGVYQLEQDVPDDEKDFDGKIGDILVGGGSGEALALRISHPEAMYFFKKDDWDNFKSYDELFKEFWSASFAFKIGVGFRKIGWEPNEKLEQWLTEKTIDMLLKKGIIKLDDNLK